MPTTTALAASQIQNCVQAAYSDIQCCPWKGLDHLTEKLKRKEYHRTTRQSLSISITLDVPLNRKESFANRGFSYATAKYWNDIPDNIKTAKDIKNFKSLLKMHFFKKAVQ